MCIIAKEVEDVKSTNILVAKYDTDHQLTVYSNKVATNVDNIMILPVPADSVEFIDFTDCKNMFADLQSIYRRRGTRSFGMMKGGKDSSPAVHKVGSYLASFAKNLSELDNLDTATFGTIDVELLEIMRKYYSPTSVFANFGFVVCRLNKGPEYEYHPFAYVHKMFYKDTLFVPTRHVHTHNNARHWNGFGSGKPEIVEKDKEHWDHNIYVYNANKIATLNGPSDIEKYTRKIELYKKDDDNYDYYFDTYELPKFPKLPKFASSDVKSVSRIEIHEDFKNDDILVTV